MSHTYTKLLSHVVFSTKDRMKLITRDMQPRLWAYMGGVTRTAEAEALGIGGIEDHAHMLLLTPARLSLSDVVRDIKAYSSKWMTQEFGMKGKFAWQTGYAAFSVSQSKAPDVLNYIAHQNEHHHGEDFKVELVKLLELHEVEYDERYLWD